MKVGVFVNETLGQKSRRSRKLPDSTRFSFTARKRPEFALELKQKTNLEIIKAFRVSPDFAPEDVLKYETDAILLDAYSPQRTRRNGRNF